MEKKLAEVTISNPDSARALDLPPACQPAIEEDINIKFILGLLVPEFQLLCRELNIQQASLVHAATVAAIAREAVTISNPDGARVLDLPSACQPTAEEEEEEEEEDEDRMKVMIDTLARKFQLHCRGLDKLQITKIYAAALGSMTDEAGRLYYADRRSSSLGRRNY